MLPNRMISVVHKVDYRPALHVLRSVGGCLVPFSKSYLAFPLELYQPLF